MTTLPTVTEARQLLVSPLRFGDAAQIAARDILAAVQECAEAIHACPHDPVGVVGGGKCRTCRGSGNCTCDDCGHVHTCVACQGSRRGNVLCECISEFRADVLLAALAQDELTPSQRTTIEDEI